MSDIAAPTRRPRRPIVVALVVVVAIAGATVVGIWLLRPLDADPPAAAGDATAVVLEPATAAGDDPFTDTITARELDDRAPFTESLVARTVEVTQELAADPVTGALGVAGTAPGLYGGSSQLSICDPESLVAFLADDPAKAAAWAGVLGIAPDAIPELVASLTPVLLTMDTLVTNHGFAAGAATPKQSVLQAGTAVMVDRMGARPCAASAATR